MNYNFEEIEAKCQEIYFKTAEEAQNNAKNVYEKCRDMINNL